MPVWLSICLSDNSAHSCHWTFCFRSQKHHPKHQQENTINKKKLYSPKDIQFFLHNFAINYTFTACEKKAIIIFSLSYFLIFVSNNFHDHAALEICKGIFSILFHTHEFCKILLFFFIVFPIFFLILKNYFNFGKISFF